MEIFLRTSCTSPRTFCTSLNLSLDTLNSIIHPHHFSVDAVSHLQELRRCHPCLFLGQCPTSPCYPRCLCFPSAYSNTSLNSVSFKEVNTRDIDSLSRPHFNSFVLIARTVTIVSTSTIISTIISVIAAVGVRTVYISSRRKKCSMRLKVSIIFSRPVLASLAAWGRCQPSK